MIVMDRDRQQESVLILLHSFVLTKLHVFSTNECNKMNMLSSRQAEYYTYTI